MPFLSDNISILRTEDIANRGLYPADSTVWTDAVSQESEGQWCLTKMEVGVIGMFIFLLCFNIFLVQVDILVNYYFLFFSGNSLYNPVVPIS